MNQHTLPPILNGEGDQFFTAAEDVSGCSQYVVDEGNIILPVGAKCTVKYTVTPNKFARYDLNNSVLYFRKSYVDSGKEEPTIDDAKQVFGVFKFIGSPDGTGTPPEDIVYTFPAAGGEVVKNIKLEMAGESSIYTLDNIGFTLTTGGQTCTGTSDCWEIANNSDTSAGKCAASNQDVTVPTAGCDLSVKFTAETPEPIYLTDSDRPLSIYI